MMTRRRAHDSPTYNPEVDRHSTPWNQLDSGMQRFLAIAGVIAILVALVGWAGRQLGFDARLTLLETRTATVERKVDATLAVSCIVARKTDPTVEPVECKRSTP